MLSRLYYVFVRFLVSIDILLQVILKTPIYVITGNAKPSAYMTISATVGKLAEERQPFGLFMQKIVDGLFGDGHCSSSWVFYKNLNNQGD